MRFWQLPLSFNNLPFCHN
uniref:Uncharacterized protein n=1 Tax=Rhizophora mucronata TaxID=61149 RepID=A0A2P2PX92_RHIMU